MFYTNSPFMPGLSSIGRGISFSSILTNAGKALNVVNQALPLVYQVKPLVNNAKTFFKVAKEFNNTDNSENINNYNNVNEPISNNYVSNYNNGPSFFI